MNIDEMRKKFEAVRLESMKPCENAIDRGEALLRLDKRMDFERGNRNHAYIKGVRDARKDIADLPNVLPMNMSETDAMNVLYSSGWLQAHDAAILHDSGPRVLAVEEVAKLPVDGGENTPVWVETRIANDKGVLTYLEASVLWFVEDGWWRRFGPIHSGWEDRKADTYGVTWRCWSSRPSDKQREEAKWD